MLIKSKTAYSVVRVYVNDDGKTVTENVDADIDGNTVSIDADTSSEYIIIFNDASPLSSGTKQDNGMTVATPGNEETTLSGTEAATSLQSTVKMIQKTIHQEIAVQTVLYFLICYFYWELFY